VVRKSKTDPATERFRQKYHSKGELYFPTVDVGVRGVAFMLATLPSSGDFSRFVRLSEFI
jgi:hypothetical protein